METKTCIRKRILAVRNQLSDAEKTEKSQQIQEKLYRLKEYREADCILGFVGYGGEVETLSFLEQAVFDGKKVYCPVSNEDGAMGFYRFTSKDDLVEGYKKIPEPSRQAEKFGVTVGKCSSDCDEGTEKYTEKKKEKVFMLMPGVVFDKKRHRIGYGKGFYDRYLESYMPDFVIAVCFECQIEEEIPTEKHDFVPHMLITELHEY